MANHAYCQPTKIIIIIIIKIHNGLVKPIMAWLNPGIKVKMKQDLILFSFGKQLVFLYTCIFQKRGNFICNPCLLECPGFADVDDENTTLILRQIINGKLLNS